MRQVDYKGLPIGVVEEGETVNAAVILCARQDEVERPKLGREAAACSFCGAALWVHPASRQAASRARLTCSHCFEKSLSKEMN